MVRHLGTPTRQLETLRRQLQTVIRPPAINPDQLGQILASRWSMY